METRDQGKERDMRMQMSKGYTHPRCAPTFSHFFLAARHPIFSMGMLTALDASRPGRPLFWAIVTTAESNNRGKAHQTETRCQYPEFERQRIAEQKQIEAIEAKRRMAAQEAEEQAKAKWRKLIPQKHLWFYKEYGYWPTEREQKKIKMQPAQASELALPGI